MSARPEATSAIAQLGFRGPPAPLRPDLLLNFDNWAALDSAQRTLAVPAHGYVNNNLLTALDAADKTLHAEYTRKPHIGQVLQFLDLRGVLGHFGRYDVTVPKFLGGPWIYLPWHALPEVVHSSEAVSRDAFDGDKIFSA